MTLNDIKQLDFNKVTKSEVINIKEQILKNDEREIVKIINWLEYINYNDDIDMQASINILSVLNQPELKIIQNKYPLDYGVNPDIDVDANEKAERNTLKIIRAGNRINDFKVNSCFKSLDEKEFVFIGDLVDDEQKSNLMAIGTTCITGEQLFYFIMHEKEDKFAKKMLIPIGEQVQLKANYKSFDANTDGSEMKSFIKVSLEDESILNLLNTKMIRLSNRTPFGCQVFDGLSFGIFTKVEFDIDSNVEDEQKIFEENRKIELEELKNQEQNMGEIEGEMSGGPGGIFDVLNKMKKNGTRIIGVGPGGGSMTLGSDGELRGQGNFHDVTEEDLNEMKNQYKGNSSSFDQIERVIAKLSSLNIPITKKELNTWTDKQVNDCEECFDAMKDEEDQLGFVRTMMLLAIEEIRKNQKNIEVIKNDKELKPFKSEELPTSEAKLEVINQLLKLVTSDISKDAQDIILDLIADLSKDSKKSNCNSTSCHCKHDDDEIDEEYDDDTSERYGKDDDDDDHMYKANELCFHVSEPEHTLGFTVCLSSIKYFKKNDCQSDDLGGHNIDKKALKKAGLCSYELMESVFEVDRGDSVEEIHQNMLDAGFVYLKEFSDFINENREEE